MTKMPRAALAVPVVLLVALLASCGHGGSDSRSSGSGGSTADGESSLAGTAPAADSGGGSKAASSTDEQGVVPINRAVISTGQISLHSKTVSRARAEVMRLVASWGGSVADEQSDSDTHGRILDSTLTLRVPSARFDKAMGELATLGKVEQQSRTAEDVTTKVVDNDARVRAGELSIRRVELLLGRAEKLSDVIAIESDLARRQADLDSLRSQQAYLADQTSLSTIIVNLARPDAPSPRHEARGFLAGLDAGWDAFKGTALALLTAVGAALPFGVVLALVGVPLWLVVRRRLAGRVSAGSAPARSA